uniref:Polycystin cation channel PKD1/PKD2 domain-containing protein n=1 Tax=Branchiostoma floridae TaxID=7739 RepID=C3ZY53_BRAFL|eukprot:XP_002586524.1 hypothetical protein BRAFLDRAFT_106424 [Branchiostoma floridae]
MMTVSSRCTVPYSDGTADRHNYTQGWIPDNTTANGTDETIMCSKHLVLPNAARTPGYHHCVGKLRDWQDVWKYTFVSFANGKKLLRPLDYISQVWNWMELLIIVLGCSTLGVYVYTQSSIDVVSEQRAAGKTAFDQYKAAANWFQVYTYLLGLLICCITLKFLRLLRFNSHVYALSLTLKKSFKPVAQFMVTAGLVITAFTMVANLTFGIKLEDFRDMPTTFKSLLVMILGAFDFEGLSEGHTVLGPLIFFGYQALMQFILLSMFMTIVMDVYARRGQETNPEDVRFVSYIKETASGAAAKVRAIPSGVRAGGSHIQEDKLPDMLENVSRVLDRLDKYSASYDRTL